MVSPFAGEAPVSQTVSFTFRPYSKYARRLLIFLPIIAAFFIGKTILFSHSPMSELPVVLTVLAVFALVFFIFWNTKFKKKFTVSETNGTVESIGSGSSMLPLNKIDQLYVYAHKTTHLVALNFYAGKKNVNVFLTNEDGEQLLNHQQVNAVKQIIEDINIPEMATTVLQGTYNKETSTTFKESISKDRAYSIIESLYN